MLCLSQRVSMFGIPLQQQLCSVMDDPGASAAASGVEWAFIMAGIAVGTGITLHALILRDTVYRVAKFFTLH